MRRNRTMPCSYHRGYQCGYQCGKEYPIPTLRIPPLGNPSTCRLPVRYLYATCSFTGICLRSWFGSQLTTSRRLKRSALCSIEWASQVARATCYLLLATCDLLLAIYYSLLTICYLLLATDDLLLNIHELLLTTSS